MRDCHAHLHHAAAVHAEGIEGIREGPARLDAAKEAYRAAGAKLKDFCPLTIRHKGRFKSAVTIKPALRLRSSGDHAPPDLVANMTGKDAGFVLRYFTGLLAMKLAREVRGFYVPVPEP
jgi:hypothetical protein